MVAFSLTRVQDKQVVLRADANVILQYPSGHVGYICHAYAGVPVADPVLIVLAGGETPESAADLQDLASCIRPSDPDGSSFCSYRRARKGFHPSDGGSFNARKASNTCVYG